jgi:hemerythrin-like domain-containing protein
MEAPRRRILVTGSLATATLLLACAGSSGGGPATPGKKPEHHEEEEVSPVEDLMREHGVLNRLLLVYEEGLRRLEVPSAEAPSEVLSATANLTRRFIEDYHEALEEQHVFPRFEKAGKQVELVATLRRQHQAGRRLTEDVLRLAGAPLTDAARGQLAASIRAFVRMYRPHEAREDTVLFPGFRSLVGEAEYKELGEQFEDKEHALFKNGFEGVVEDVEQLEKRLGINDLNTFTPAL